MAETQFALHANVRESVNSLWRIAHRYEKRTVFAELAVRLIPSGVSEAGTDRALSMQRNIGGLHGTRFRITIMKARLRSMRNPLTERVSRGESNEMPVGRAEGGRLQFTTEDLIKEAADEQHSEGHSDNDSENDSVVNEDSDSER
jgi:phosphoribosylformylglycinamidine (FGAM) synthase-like amidotransferase family enzyme